MTTKAITTTITAKIKEKHMTDGTQLFGGPYAHDPDDLIVSRQHRDLVRAELPRGSVAKIVDSDLLGLTRIKISDIGATAAAVRDKVLLEVTDPGEPPSSSLNLLLWSLRTLFAHRYAGWTPSMGKNRLVGRIHGVGEVNHGGGSDPEVCDPPYARPGREQGPGRGVRVGVLDTGFYPQPWLAGGWVARYADRIADGQDLMFSDGHATFVTGLVLSQAPEAIVEVRRVLQSTANPKTNGSADSWSVGEAIVEFGNSGLDVLNLSFVCYTEDGQPPMVLSAAIDRLPPDLVVVAAAGNHGDVVDPHTAVRDERASIKPGWPAALDDVVAVGAVTQDGTGLAPFSPDAPWIDVLAQGHGLISTYLSEARASKRQKAKTFGGWARWDGTSFAAALVSGAVAASTQPDRYPARAALRGIMAALDTSEEKTIGRTGARVLRLRTL